MKVSLLLLFAFVASTVNGAPLDEDFGYVDVRPGAHMFWVVYHTELSDDWTQAPLIMWLQGGPGASGVGYGNFKELGPYDIDGNLRPGRWTQKANLMFVDNPVGTGYSYVDDLSLLTTTNAEIADDLVTLLQSAYASYPEMETMPFFVYAESYGGKMTADFARALDVAITNGEINCNFQGIAMGDSWVSPMDSVNTWGAFLYSMGFVNADGQAHIDTAAARTQSAVDAENWVQATYDWSITEGVVLTETDGVDFYNVLAEDSSVYNFRAEISNDKHKNVKPELLESFLRHTLPMSKETRDELTDFMNGPQAEQWNIPDTVVWGSQSGDVFTYLQEDFMKPVVTSVSDLLENTNIHVAVFTGDLDLICDTPGTYRWIENMEYPQKVDYEATERQSLQVTVYPNNAGYVQRFERFSVFTILRSGHMVPIDAPEMALDMIDMITQYGAEAAAGAEAKAELKNKVKLVHSKLEAVKEKETKKEAPEKVEKKEEVEKVVAKKEAKKEAPKKVEKKEEVKKVVEKKEAKKEEAKKEEVKRVVKEKYEQIKNIKKENPEQTNLKHKTEALKAAVHEEPQEPKKYEKIEVDPKVGEMLKTRLHSPNQSFHPRTPKEVKAEAPEAKEPTAPKLSSEKIRELKVHASKPSHSGRRVFHNAPHRAPHH